MPCAPEPFQPHHLHHHHHHNPHHHNNQLNHNHHHQLQSSSLIGSASSILNHHHHHHHHHRELASSPNATTTTTSRRPNGLFSPVNEAPARNSLSNGRQSPSSTSSSSSTTSSIGNLASDFHVFDRRTAELSARAVDYLLNCHTAELRLQEPPAKEEEEAAAAVKSAGRGSGARSPTAASATARMAATTAKHELRRSSQGTTGTGASSSSPGDEDIAAIAKQISDHAEAIYQTWKSRGLAPTEILNCHSNAAAVDKFGTVLTPTSPSSSAANNISSSINSNNPTSVTKKLTSTSPVDLLTQDNNNLEKLVNNFVVEDKARIAASRQRSPSKSLPSSIQFALQKFEQSSSNSGSTPTTPKTPTSSLNKGSSFVSRPSQLKTGLSSSLTKSSLSSSSSPHHSDIFLETIEAAGSFPNEVITPSKIAAAVQQQKRSNMVTSPTQQMMLMHELQQQQQQTSNGMIGSSWPLKNKIVVNDSSRKQPTTVQIIKNPTTLNNDVISKQQTDSLNNKNYLDEVAREEERLINALKTGAVITDEHVIDSPRVTTVPMTSSMTTTVPQQQQHHQQQQQQQPIISKQKPAIVREKPKVDPVKPILISPVKPIQIGGAHLNSSGAMVSAHIINSPSNEVKTFSKDELSALSAVDYAKLRCYRAGTSATTPTTATTVVEQQQPQQQQKETSTVQRLEDQQQLKSPTSYASETIVSNARSKFESEDNDKTITSTTTTSTSVKDSKDEKDFIASRWGLRLNSSRPRPVEPVPHPELTTQQKQHIRAAAATNTGNNPVRPFLTRGSVAERVLIFEKCPSELLLDKRGPRQTGSGNWRSGSQETPAKPLSYARDKAQPKSLPPHTTLQRHVKANRNVHIPSNAHDDLDTQARSRPLSLLPQHHNQTITKICRFHFPGGKPVPLSQIDATIARISSAFQSLPGHRASRSQFHIVTKACDLPLYWKVPLFLASGGDTNGIIEMSEFLDFWKELTNSHHDGASKFVRIATRGLRACIYPEDLIPLVQDVVETHPGLTFLKEATEFHSRYVHTVIARIFYCVNRSWSGRISVSELRRSNLLSVIGVLEHEEDINQVTAYFSYEHFYVIYCKFWELDRDHDLFIDKMDLTRHNDHALSTRMIERIFSGAVTRGGVKNANNGAQQHLEDKMSYTEFVWFLLSEEDKNHPTAIEYWFRCMDLDGDGYLSMYELEYFYEEQLHRMEAIGIETLPFEDCLCQMLDMIHPSIPGKISLSDLKRCKMTSIFFDTFFNLEKYLDHEQRDPFASARDHDADGHELSDWDRFAAEEYELLVAEESGNEQNDQSLYDTVADDEYSPNLDLLIGDAADTSSSSSSLSQTDRLNSASTSSSTSTTGYTNDHHHHDQQSNNRRNAAKNSTSLNYESCDSDDYADSDDN